MLRLGLRQLQLALALLLCICLSMVWMESMMIDRILLAPDSSQSTTTTTVVDLYQAWDSPRSQWAHNDTKPIHSKYPDPPLRRLLIPNAFLPTCPRSSSSSKPTITIATHLSTSKFERLRLVAKQWGYGAPVSAAVYVTSKDDIDALTLFWKEHGTSRDLCGVTVHVLMEDNIEDKSRPSSSPLDYGYPHNRLRDLALQSIPPSSSRQYFLTTDVDFVTLANGNAILRKLLSDHDSLVQELVSNRTLLVLPAFDYLVSNQNNVTDSWWSDHLEELLPSNRKELARDIKQKKLVSGGTTDHLSVWMTAFHNRSGHKPENYDKWLGLDHVIDSPAWYPTTEYIANFEPYVMGYLDRQNLPRYKYDFRGFGNNKISWISTLYCMGYKFWVLRDMAVIHLGHPSTRTTNVIHARTLRIRNRNIMDRYRSQMSKLYPDTCGKVKINY